MARDNIIIFKCLVNISVQDFDVHCTFCHSGGRNQIRSQHAGLCFLLEDVPEVPKGGGMVQHWFVLWFGPRLMTPSIMEWLNGIESLLGWVWWLWEVSLEGY